jgi:tetratricopeptide (TPR) repeat protein
LPRVARRQPADRLRIVERALVLHTDIATMHRGPRDYRGLAPGRNVASLFQDGQVQGQAAGTYHWEFARRLIEQLPRGEERLRVGRLFYRATGALLQGWMEYAELRPHLAAAGRVLPEDPVLLLYVGTMDHAYGGPRMQRFFDDQERAARTGPITSNQTVSIPSSLPSPRRPTSSTFLGLAERTFRRTLEIEPGLVEARIRLAHVLSDLQRYDEAVATLAPIATMPLPPLMDYYASLVAGRAARARGETDAAQAAFERAAVIYPRAPAPWYGLSDLAASRGDAIQALDYLQRVAMTKYEAGGEPWWQLDRIHSPSAQELIDEMRRGFSP